ncbi:MAG: type II secretion system F family protein [Candidatus Omnitrophota bacterium]
MPNFRYTARTKDGSLKRGVFSSNNEDDLVEALQSRGLIVISFALTEKSNRRAKKGKRFHTKVSQDDLIIFARQLTTLINAGISLLRSLEITSEQVTSRRLNEALLGTKKDVAGGSSLSDSIAKYPKIFSRFWVNIIETGEATGQLGFALEQLAPYLEATAAFKRKIINALIYPAVILGVAFVAIIVFVMKLIPMFANIYSGFGAELPLFTQIVFNISMTIKKFILLEIGLIVGIIFMFRSYQRTASGKRTIDKFLLAAPIVGNLVRQISGVRFAKGLSMLIKSGTPILHAMDIVIESAGNVIIMDVLTKVKENVRQGKTMSAPMIESDVFPDMLSHMVGVGEESGELANMLEKAALFYQERVDATITRLTALFEPALIVGIGVIVGALVVAMYLPIFNLASALK